MLPLSLSFVAWNLIPFVLGARPSVFFHETGAFFFLSFSGLVFGGSHVFALSLPFILSPSLLLRCLLASSRHRGCDHHRFLPGIARMDARLAWSSPPLSLTFLPFFLSSRDLFKDFFFFLYLVVALLPVYRSRSFPSTLFFSLLCFVCSMR